jgi:hypothetical protein
MLSVKAFCINICLTAEIRLFFHVYPVGCKLMNRSRGPNGKSKQARCWLTLISRGGEGEAKKEAPKIYQIIFLIVFF